MRHRAAVCLSPSVPTPPIAKQVPTERTHHGDTVIDPYAWLADPKDPEVIAYLEAENAYTEASTAGLGDLRSAIFDEIKARTQETDLSVPVRKGNWWRYARTVEGQQYAIHCRRRVAEGEITPPMPEDGKPLDGEEVLLDGNELAAGAAFFSLGALSVSPDERLLAYSTDFSGDERFTLRVKDLATGSVLDDEVPDTYYGCAWSRDGSTLFYVTVDEAWRPYRVWRHVVGTPAADDVVVFEEADEKFWLGVGHQPRRAVHRDPHRVQADQRGVAARRGRPVGLLRRGRAPAARRGVRRRGGRRPAAHPAQRRRRELRAGRRAAARRARVRRRRLLDAGDRAPGRHPAAVGGRVRRLPGALLPPRRPDRAVGAARLRGRPGAAGRLPRADLHGRPGIQPGVHADPVPARLHLDGHPVHRLRPGPGDRRPHPAEAAAGAALPVRGRLRPRRLRAVPGVGGGRRRHPGADLDRLPEGHPARRIRALPAVRVRQLRDLDRPQLLDLPAFAARPGIRVRDRAHQGRRRDGPALVRRREDADQAEHVHRLRGVRRSTWPRPAGRPRRG